MAGKVVWTKANLLSIFKSNFKKVAFFYVDLN